MQLSPVMHLIGRRGSFYYSFDNYNNNQHIVPAPVLRLAGKARQTCNRDHSQQRGEFRRRYRFERKHVWSSWEAEWRQASKNYRKSRGLIGDCARYLMSKWMLSKTSGQESVTVPFSFQTTPNTAEIVLAHTLQRWWNQEQRFLSYGSQSWTVQGWEAHVWWGLSGCAIPWWKGIRAIPERRAWTLPVSVIGS